MRSMVEGPFGACGKEPLHRASRGPPPPQKRGRNLRAALPAQVDDETYHRFHLAKNIRGGDPHRHHALLRQQPVAPLVARRVATHFMGDAIHLHPQSGLVAEEIQDEGTQWMLVTEFEPAGPGAKLLPQ
jgi:hypothetical protein